MISSSRCTQQPRQFGERADFPLRISRQDCLEFAARYTWEASARAFIEHMAEIGCPTPQSDVVPLISEQPRFVA